MTRQFGVWCLLLTVAIWQSGFVAASPRGGRGGGGRSSGGRSSSGSRSGGRSSSSRTTGSRYYSGNYGRSSSSGGFGLGLGGGLLLGYSMGGHSYGHGYRHRYGQHATGTYDTTRPISCYSGSTASKISEDVLLEENLTECDSQEDVCYGKVVLTVSNTTTSSHGFLEAEKGCGNRSALESIYKAKASFDSDRQCFTTNIAKSNRVVNNLFTDNSSVPVLSTSTDQSTSTSTQEELCICDGSKCNTGHGKESAMLHIWFVIMALAWMIY